MTQEMVRPVAHAEFFFDPRPWPFAKERAADIAAYFTALRRAKPALWNGRVLLLRDHSFENGILRGSYLETDFADFIAWREWGFPDPAIRNCFAQGALRGSDGAFVAGVMAPHTFNAGRVYFPSGTPDPDDIVDGKVDLDHSLNRELLEETGLGLDHFRHASEWHAVFIGPLIALMKVLQANEPAAALRERILRNIATQPEPELSDARIITGPDDLDSTMPAYMCAYLRAIWRGL